MSPSATRTRASSRSTSSNSNKVTVPSISATTSAKKGKPTPLSSKKTSTTKAGSKKRTKQEESEHEEESEEDQDNESDNNYKSDSESEEDEDGDDSDDDDFQSNNVKTRKSNTKASAKAMAKKAPTTSKTAKSTNPAKKVKTSATSSAPAKSTTTKGASKKIKPEPTKTFQVSTLKIPRPKGGNPVADAIQPETLEFLRDLKLNNDREYMMLNQERCDQAKADFLDFIRMIKEGLLEADPDVMDQEPKLAMMRIHRDIRFSNDKTPYKSRFSCYFSKGGKKSIAAGYYFSISSNGESFAGCGAWDNAAAALTRIRHGIVNHADRFNEILSTDAIKNITGGKTGLDALRPDQNALKTGPVGFDKEHAMIEFLKRKSFAIGRSFTDEQVVNEGFLEEVLQTFDACVPFVQILNDWIG
ncbi:hypothetical protein FBU30_000988 [Linnemannia zychae]|nr:hypothetical protein FBU30_000988 [Linnemannia zychae]